MRAIGWALAAALCTGCTTTALGTEPPLADGGSPSAAPGQQHSLHLHVTGNGEVRASAPAFSCRSDCQQGIDPATTVHLAAIPDAGWKFEGWQGACAGTSGCDLAMSSDHDVTATFTAIPAPPEGQVRVNVVFVGDGSGRVTSSPAGIDCPSSACNTAVPIGTVVALSAQADGNSTFMGWGGGCSGGGGCSVTANSAVTVWANFVANAPPGGSGAGSNGGPPAQCSGISAPDAVAMQQYVARPQGAVACGQGLGDQNGTLAFPMGFHDPNAHGSLIDFVSAANGFVREQFSASESLRPLQQPSGLASAGDAGHLYPFGPSVRLGRWDTSGNWLGDAVWRAQNHAPAEDVNGGVFLAGDLSPSTSGPLSHEAVMFNGGGAAYGVKWGPQPLASSGAVFGAGVDVLGRALVVTGGSAPFGAGSITAQWFDRNGTPLTGEFVLVTGFVPGSSTWFETSPLLGGGVEVRRMDLAGGVYHAKALVLVQSGAAVVQPPPRWMTDRPDTKLQIVRGGKAYAVLPYGAANVPCTQKVEIVAADGTSCGSTSYPIAAGTCNTPDLSVAQDGTVIQGLPASMETVTNEFRAWHTCTWRWWTRAAQ